MGSRRFVPPRREHNPITEPTTEAAIEPAVDVDVLDPEIVERLERLGAAAGEDLMGQLTILYLADSQDRLNELRSALAAHDATAIYRAAHTLAGASVNIGAIRLSHLCTALATKSQSGDLADGDALVAELEAELACVRSTLESRSVTP